jgi:aspartate ammonia-lyase
MAKTAAARVRSQLKSTDFFSGLTDTDYYNLSTHIAEQNFAAGEYIFREGEPRQVLLALTRGSVAIEKKRGGDQATLATFGVGECVGEGLLLDQSTHGTSCRALEDTDALVLHRQKVDQIIRESPTLYAALVSRAARAISRRLSAVDATLVGRGRTTGFAGGDKRVEHDMLGDREIPGEALYGVQTLRAVENFPISPAALRDFPTLVNSLAAVKEAAALANQELGLLDPAITDAIVAASREIRSGRHHEHFIVGMIQGGAGTSSNMNANEVIANRALELMGKKRGEFDLLSPNNHVNLSQSTNDVYPTAVKIALHSSIAQLQESMRELAESFLDKGDEFRDLVKMGRTQLQDAVPMTLGREFAAFGHTILEDVDRLGESQALIREINMGATAIGTGINTPPGYTEAVRRHLSGITGLELITAPDLIEATADTGVFVQLSGVLKRCAVKLSKICNDLRLLSSGPRAGLNEINLPAVQPGSSIMPGKVNPVIPEVVNQVCFEIIGGDMTVTMAAEAGQLQLNVFEPIIAFRLLRGLESMRNACRVLRERCIVGITANREQLRRFVENSIGVVTALVPVLGYDVATEIATEALSSGRGVYEIVLERGLLDKAQLDSLLNPSEMMTPRLVRPRG